MLRDSNPNDFWTNSRTCGLQMAFARFWLWRRTGNMTRFWSPESSGRNLTDLFNNRTSNRFSVQVSRLDENSNNGDQLTLEKTSRRQLQTECLQQNLNFKPVDGQGFHLKWVIWKFEFQSQGHLSDNLKGENLNGNLKRTLNFRLRWQWNTRPMTSGNQELWFAWTFYLLSTRTLGDSISGPHWKCPIGGQFFMLFNYRPFIS